jgi:RsbT co-antagonist protein rsbRD N-terminal domain
VTSLPVILRDHREELWRRWVDALADAVDSDYRELVASQLGDRMLRTMIDDLIAFSEAEQYERLGMLRAMEERATADARHRLALGFTVLDAVVSLQTLRAAISDVLVDALVLDEMPAFADTLDQLKVVNALLDRLVCAAVVADEAAQHD